MPSIDLPQLSDIRIDSDTLKRPNASPSNVWTVSISNCRPIANVAKIDHENGEVLIANREYDYDLPLVFIRSAGDVVLWFVNPRFGGISQFDRSPVIAFGTAEYLQQVSVVTTSNPPLISREEVSSLTAMTLNQLPMHADAEYCVPSFRADASGRILLRDYRDSLSSPTIELPVTNTADRFATGFERHEVGCTRGRELVIDVVNGDDRIWYRLAKPGFFPARIGIA